MNEALNNPSGHRSRRSPRILCILTLLAWIGATGSFITLLYFDFKSFYESFVYAFYFAVLTSILGIAFSLFAFFMATGKRRWLFLTPAALIVATPVLLAFVAVCVKLVSSIWEATMSWP